VGLLSGLLLSKNPSPQVSEDSGKRSKEFQEKVIAPTLREYSKDLQQCYLEHLKSNPVKTEGSVFVVMKVEDDGSLSSVKIARSDFMENQMNHCLSAKIEKYHFAPPPMGINRFFSHTLSFKSEENAMREAKERKQEALLPKVLPAR